MKRTRYTEEQFISILKTQQAGSSAPDIAHPHEVAKNTIYHCNSKFGGMEVPEAVSPKHSNRGTLKILIRLLWCRGSEPGRAAQLPPIPGRSLAAGHSKRRCMESWHGCNGRHTSWRSQ